MQSLLPHSSPSVSHFIVMQALSYMDEDFLMQLEGMYLDKAHAVKLPVHLNMAACQLQLGDYHTAIYNCTEVRFSLEPPDPGARGAAGLPSLPSKTEPCCCRAPGSGPEKRKIAVNALRAQQHP